LLAVSSVVLLTAACSGSEPDAEAADAATPPPREQLAPDMEQCLTDKGWEVKAGAGNRLTLSGGGTGANEIERFLADQEDCYTEYGYDVARPRITEAEAHALWDELLAAAECVEELGYHVAEPPSRAFAVERLQQPVIDLGWWPHENVPALEQNRSHTECPTPAL
jgi:hypothetical protein